MSEKLQPALKSLSDALPFSPQWVGVISVDGIHMGYYGLESLEEDRATALMAASEGLHSRLTYEIGNGAFRYAIIGAENGVFVTLVFKDVAVVGMNFDQIPAFDKLLRALPEALSSLLRVLGLA